MTSNIDHSSAPLLTEDFFWLEHAEPAFDFGMEIEGWWKEKTSSWPDILDLERVREILASDFHGHAFLLTRPSSQWPEDLSYGFYDRALLGDRTVPVVGRFQQMMFDRPKAPPSAGLEWWRDNLRAFAVDNILRRGHFTNPIVAQPDEHRPLAPYLRPFSLFSTPHPIEPERGLISSQLYYRRRNGRVGKFWPPDRLGLDFRVAEKKYRWLVAQFQLEPAKIRQAPAGRQFPYVTLPVQSGVMGVVKPGSVIDDSAPRGDRLGRYGVSFALLCNPWTHLPLGGFGKLLFVVRDSGEIFLQNTVVNIHPS